VSLDLAPHRPALEELCRRHHVRRLELFGSAATARYRPAESDLDFLVEFEPLPPGTYADTYFDLLEGLQQLFGKRVDLVVASAITNPYFRQSVEQTKILLYGT
jgi:uncharacterized protein